MAKKKAKSSSSTYTKPKLREKIKKEVKDGDKGGKEGQWSARKSQLVAQKYKAAGGGYDKEKGAPQKSLDAWTDEKWTTADGKKARKGDTTDRYLPNEAWEKMSPAQKKKTRKKKQAGAKAGAQYVENTGDAKESRKKVTKKKATKKAASKKVTEKAAKKTTKKTAAKKTAKKTTAKKKTTKKAVGRPRKKQG